jgi:hypothetical protein
MENKRRQYVWGFIGAALITAVALSDLSRNIRRLRAAPVGDTDSEFFVKTTLFMLGMAIWFWAMALMNYADYKAEQAVRAPEAIQKERPFWREGVFLLAALVVFVAWFWWWA